MESARRADICARSGQNDSENFPHLPAPVLPGTLANLVEVMIALDLHTELTTLSRALTVQCELIPELELYNLYLPFLSILITKLERISVESYSDPVYQNLFLEVVRQYWRKYAESKPQMHWFLRSREINHNKCPTCLTLDGFLFDGNKQSFSMSNHAKPSAYGNRYHVLDALRKLNCLSYTEDKAAGKLHITKRTSDFQMELKQWEVRGFNVRALLRGVNQQLLTELLGAQFQSLTGIFTPINPARVTVPPKQQRAGQAFCSSPLRYGHKLSPEKKPQASHSWDSSQDDIQIDCTAGFSQSGICVPPVGRIPLAPISQNSDPICGTKRKHEGHHESPRNCPTQPGA